MTPEQIRLVQDSFKLVEPMAGQAADLFYERLFTLEPSVRALFVRDLRKQGAMLMQAIGLAVRNLDRPQDIAPVVRQLGQRHVQYGARPEYFDVVGECLLWTLEQGLGDAFNSELRAAWATTYKLLAEQMQLAMQEATTPAGSRAAATTPPDAGSRTAGP